MNNMSLAILIAALGVWLSVLSGVYCALARSFWWTLLSAISFLLNMGLLIHLLLELHR